MREDMYFTHTLMFLLHVCFHDVNLSIMCIFSKSVYFHSPQVFVQCACFQCFHIVHVFMIFMFLHCACCHEAFAVFVFSKFSCF